MLPRKDIAIIKRQAIERDEKKIQLVYWSGISLIILIADYFAGPYIQFPITYLLPITLAAWFRGRFWGFTFAIAMPLVRFYFNIVLWTIPWTYVEATINCIIRITLFMIFVILIDAIAKRNRELANEVEMLSGLLPMCANCKKIRNDSNEWEEIETFITNRTDASFTHGICPVCKEKLYGAEMRKIKEKKS
jgi:hypothetical protein